MSPHRFLSISSLVLSAVLILSGCWDDTDSQNHSVTNDTELLSMSQCVDFCEFEWDCLGSDGIPEVLWKQELDCRSMCDAIVPVSNCIFSLMDDTCRQRYRELYQCEYNLTVCDEFDSYMDGVEAVLEGSDATSYKCGAKFSAYYDDCAEGLEKMIEEDPFECETEIDAMDALLTEATE